jgi:hypothetical protein
LRLQSSVSWVLGDASGLNICDAGEEDSIEFKHAVGNGKEAVAKQTLGGMVGRMRMLGVCCS